MKPLWTGLLGVGLAVVLGVGGFVVARYLPELFPELERLAHDPACDLREGPCTSPLPGGGRVEFGVEPRDLPLMQPLALSVLLEGLAVDGVQVDIIGLNMDMGVNRTRLEHRGEGLWTGTTLLPVCSQQVMKWEAAVWLERDGRTVAVPHLFETRR